MTCLGQVNQGKWCQESYETASRDSRRRARQLRKHGYDVTCSPMGPQVTPLGIIKLTLVSIYPGQHEFTDRLPADGWKLESWPR